MAKASKMAKARIKRMNMGEKAAVKKAAIVLADAYLITDKRYNAIIRALKR